MEINKDILCHYGCGRKATHKLKNGILCCSDNHRKCPVIISKRIENQKGKKRKKCKNITKPLFVEESDNLCDYGCGQIAKYFFTKSKKWYCHVTYKSCPVIIEKTTRKNLGKKVKSSEFKNENKILCDYGCGNEARFILDFTNSKKYCCSKNYSGCQTNIKTWNKGLTKELDSRIEKYTIKNTGKKRTMIDFYLKNCKDFLEIEYLEEDPNTKELIVKCNICGDKFVPPRRRIEHRLKVIREGNLDFGKFICSTCKRKLKYNRKSYLIYQDIVFKETEKTVKKYKSKIENIELRGLKKGYDLDHMFSIREGFNNGILPIIIAHFKNLKILLSGENRIKSKKCSITLEELFKEVESDQFYKKQS